MPGLTSLAIAEADERVAQALRYGFEREGVHVELARDTAEVASRADDLQVLVVGSRVNGVSGTQFLTELGESGGSGAPVLYIGNYTERANAMAAGAALFLGRPAFVRDAVTVCRLLAGLEGGHSSAPAVGELSEHRGPYYLVRAVCALSFTGVLTLVRGLRRGEMRFFAGEVTSASLGLLHGQAALHQLMLWTEARVELRAEDVVPRRQIPMSPEDLLEDARRFLLEMRSIAPWLSPSAVYRRAVDGAGDNSTLPLEIEPVLQLFDGHRTVADAIEDSPFRLFETLRVAARLVRLGRLELRSRADEGSPSETMTLDDWLVGPPEADAGESETAADSDWEAILPSTDGAAEGYASVVPSQSTGGEIDLPGVEPRPPRPPTEDTRPLPKLETLAADAERDVAGDAATSEPGPIAAPTSAAQSQTPEPESASMQAPAIRAPSADESARSQQVADLAGAGADDSPQQATQSSPAERSDGRPVQEAPAPDEQQRAALNDAAGAIARAASVVASAARRAASEPAGDGGRDNAATAGEIEAAASAPSEPRGEPEQAGTIVVDGASGGQPSAKPRAPTNPELAADAGRVAAGAALTARAAAAAFTAAEEAFFAAGDEIARSRPEPVDTFADLDDGVVEDVRPGLVGRLFRKRK